MYEFKSTKSFVKFLNKFDTVFIKVAFSKKKGHISNIAETNLTIFQFTKH